MVSVIMNIIKVPVHLCLSIVPAAVTNFSVVQEYPNDTNATVVDVTVYWDKVRFILIEN